MDVTHSPALYYTFVAPCRQAAASHLERDPVGLAIAHPITTLKQNQETLTAIEKRVM